MTSSTLDPRERLYVDLSKRLHRATNLGAIVINAMIVVSTWGNWEAFAIAVGLYAVIFPLNMMVNRLVLRHGPRVEIGRAVMNQAVCAVAYQWIGWPIVVWLWLPFIPLAFDALGGRPSMMVLIIMCSVQDVAALIGGVPVQIPIVFTALAIMAWALVNARVQIIREMLVSAAGRADELAAAHEQLKAEVAARERAELELRQAQRLESIGRLAAGIAHEINTPMQFIGNSLEFIEEGVAELLEICARPGDQPGELAYLQAHLPKAISLVDDGVARVAAIVRSMKQFAHPGGELRGPVDLNQAIESTLTISRHEYRLVADVHASLGPLPPVDCRGAEINQVLLNILVNAAHAVQDACDASGQRGRIDVASRVDGSDVVVTVRDTGPGIPAEIRERVFDPFFTTKPVGRGTGQGLAIAYSVIERHHGKLSFVSEPGAGTTFEIRLPIAGQSPSVLRAA